MFGYGVLLTSLLALLTPIAARYHVMALLGVRIFQGLFLVSIRQAMRNRFNANNFDDEFIDRVEDYENNFCTKKSGRLKFLPKAGEKKFSLKKFDVMVSPASFVILEVTLFLFSLCRVSHFHVITQFGVIGRRL